MFYRENATFDDGSTSSNEIAKQDNTANTSNNNNHKNRKSFYSSYQASDASSTSSSSSSSLKRKLFDYEENSTEKYKKSHSSIYSSKPVHTEYVNPKSLRNIYYKVDMRAAIDDHFSRSLNISTNAVSKIAKLTLKNAKSNTSSQYWQGASGSSTQNSLNSTYDVSAWPYHYSYSGNSTSTPNTSSSSSNYGSWNRAAADMAASLYSNHHYVTSLSNIHQYNPILMNDANNKMDAVKNTDLNLNNILNSNSYHFQTPQQISNSGTQQSPIDSYNIADLNAPKSTHYTSNYPASSETNFIDYAASTANASTSAVVKVAAAAAAVAANQYLNATNSHSTASYQHRFPSQYHLNHHFGDLTKSSIQDCRRANYSHLTTHLPYSGFDLTAAAVDAAFKDSTANTYGTPLWY